MTALDDGPELRGVRDADFDWMLGGQGGPPGLSLPPGGVDTPESLAVVRAIHAAAAATATATDGAGVWMMVAGGEVVGLCGAVRPADGSGVLEIGYGVAPARRRRGHASRAVRALAARARRDASVTAVTAVTAEDNLPSQAVLIRNGFAEAGREVRDDDGPVILWRLDLGRLDLERPQLSAPLAFPESVHTCYRQPHRDMTHRDMAHRGGS